MLSTLSHRFYLHVSPSAGPANDTKMTRFLFQLLSLHMVTFISFHYYMAVVMTGSWLRFRFLFHSPSAPSIPVCHCPVYERYQSRLARLYGFINGGFQLAVEGGARGVFAHWARGLFGVLCLRARGFWHHQVGVFKPNSAGALGRLHAHKTHTVIRGVSGCGVVRQAWLWSEAGRSPKIT